MTAVHVLTHHHKQMPVLGKKWEIDVNKILKKNQYFSKIAK